MCIMKFTLMGSRLPVMFVTRIELKLVGPTCNAPFIQSPQGRSAAVYIVSNKCVFSNFLNTVTQEKSKFRL